MSINLTLIGQIITFLVFIWFTMRYVWPPIMKAITDRQATIATGLEAGERGRRELDLAKHKSTEILREAKLEASHLIEQANKRAVQILEEAKEQARKEGRQIIDYARTEVDQMKASASESLRRELADLVASGTQRVITATIDRHTNDKVVAELVEELS